MTHLDVFPATDSWLSLMFILAYAYGAAGSLFLIVAA